jgi:hypothetical protein
MSTDRSSLTNEQLAELEKSAADYFGCGSDGTECYGACSRDVLALIAEVRELRAASLSASGVAQLRVFVEANAGNDDREALAPVLKRLGIDLPPFEI